MENQIKHFNHPQLGRFSLQQMYWYSAPRNGSRLLVYLPMDEAGEQALAWRTNINHRESDGWQCAIFGCPAGAAGRFPPSGSREGKALPGSLLCYLWLQRTLRSRYAFCVMSLMAQGRTGGASRRPPVPRAPASIAAARAFDFSLQASGRAEQRPCKRPSARIHAGLAGNVSAMLRPQQRQFQSH